MRTSKEKYRRGRLTFFEQISADFEWNEEIQLAFRCPLARSNFKAGLTQYPKIVVKGAEHFARIRSYISTARKQRRNILDSITAAIKGNPFLPAESPRLLPVVYIYQLYTGFDRLRCRPI